MIRSLITTLFLSVSCFGHYAEKQSLYNHLVSVNQEWSEYIQEKGKFTKEVSFGSEQELLRQHFYNVINVLKKAETASLDSHQKKNRKKHLDVLKAYAEAGAFPVNYDHPECNKPCFIDEDGGICAVGQLLIESGNRVLAYHIAATTKYAFIREMEFPELESWQKESGFTKEEIALIQPSYHWKPRYKKSPLFEFSPVLSIHIYSPSHKQVENNVFTEDVPQAANNWKFNFAMRMGKESNLLFRTGFGVTRHRYTRIVHGNFGAAAQAGMIVYATENEYMDFPLHFIIRSKRKYEGTLGFNCALFMGNHSRYAVTGSATATEMHLFRESDASFRPVLWSLSGGIRWKLKINRHDRSGLTLEPNFSYALSSNSRISRSGTRISVLSLNTGLVFESNSKHPRIKRIISPKF